MKREQERTAKRAASQGPGGDYNTPGQHFTCVTSRRPQREERGVARWPAGRWGCQADAGGCMSHKAGTRAFTHKTPFLFFADKCDSVSARSARAKK